MELKTIAEVSKLSDGMPVEKVVGEIGFIGTPKDSSFQKDGKTITTRTQGIALKDSTGSIWVEIKDHLDIPTTFKGKTVTFEGWYDENHKKWAGMSKTSYEKINKETQAVSIMPKLNVTKTGKMIIGTAEPKKETVPTAGESPKEQPKTETQANSTVMTKADWAMKDLIADRSIAFSYAKDAFVVGNIGLKDIIDFAELAFQFMRNDIEKAKLSVIAIEARQEKGLLEDSFGEK